MFGCILFNDKSILLGDYKWWLRSNLGTGSSTYEVNHFWFLIWWSYDFTSEAGLRCFIFNEIMWLITFTISNEIVRQLILEGSEILFIPFNLIANYGNTTSDSLTSKSVRTNRRRASGFECGWRCCGNTMGYGHFASNYATATDCSWRHSSLNTYTMEHWRNWGIYCSCTNHKIHTHSPWLISWKQSFVDEWLSV